jgi:hypothetical protein
VQILPLIARRSRCFSVVRRIVECRQCRQVRDIHMYEEQVYDISA